MNRPGSPPSDQVIPYDDLVALLRSDSFLSFENEVTGALRLPLSEYGGDVIRLHKELRSAQIAGDFLTHCYGAGRIGFQRFVLFNMRYGQEDFGEEFSPGENPISKILPIPARLSA